MQHNICCFSMTFKRRFCHLLVLPLIFLGVSFPSAGIGVLLKCPVFLAVNRKKEILVYLLWRAGGNDWYGFKVIITLNAHVGREIVIHVYVRLGHFVYFAKFLCGRIYSLYTTNSI